MSTFNRDALGEAADRGLLAAFWADRKPDRVAVRSESGNRTFAEINANANRLVRALRARGVRAGDGVALMCSNRPEFVETVVAARSAGPAPDDDQLAPHCRRGGVHRRRLRGDRVRRRRPFRRRRGGSRRARARLAACVAVGGDVAGFEGWDEVLAGAVGRADRRSAGGPHDALHVGDDGPPQGRASPVGSERRPRSRFADGVRPRCACALVHRTAVSRGAARALVVGAGRARRADRDDGRMVRRRDAEARRAASDHAHAHGPDDVPPSALAPRRRKARVRPLVADLHPARRGAVPGRGEAAVDGLAGADRLGVLRRDRRGRDPGEPAGVAPAPGHGRQGRPARPRPDPRRRRRRRCRGARSAPST